MASKASATARIRASKGISSPLETFAPDGMKLEEYIGVPANMGIDDLKGLTFPASSYTSYLPSYATEEKIEEWVSKRTIPTISVGQALGPGALVSQMVLHLLGRKKPLIVPEKWQVQFE